MRLRSHRRAVVVWRVSPGSGARCRTGRPARLGRTGRLRRGIRIAALLGVIGLVRMASAARLRWRPLLVGGVLTVAGVVLRSGPASLVFIPGILLLLYTPLIEARPRARQAHRSELWRELAGYATPAQRCDLEATLDRYPDAVTGELRDILARQPLATAGSGIPGVRRY
jgi:hypothetical protein